MLMSPADVPGRIVAAVSLVDIGALDLAAGEPFGGFNDKRRACGLSSRSPITKRVLMPGRPPPIPRAEFSRVEKRWIAICNRSAQFRCGFDRSVQSHAQTSLPTAKITTHAMRNRKIETATSLCFLNSLNPSLSRVGRRKKIERTKRKIGIAAATKAIILKIIVHSFLVLLQAGGLTFSSA